MNEISSRPYPDTLERWLTGPRFEGLPARSAALAPPALSFEFSPPRNEVLEAQLWTCIRRLESLRPRFVSWSEGTPAWRAWPESRHWCRLPT